MPRLPLLLDRSDLPENARHVHDELMRSRGNVAKSYAAMLHAPELVHRIAQLATHIRYESGLSRLMLEAIALTASSEYGNVYEVAVHLPQAEKAGIAPAVAAVITGKQALDGIDEEIALPVAWARELIRTHTVSAQTFDVIRQKLGEAGSVQFLSAVGMYAMLALVQNGLDVGLPQG